VPTGQSFDPPPGPLRTSVSRGATTIGLSQAVQILVQLISVLVLSRLLSPGDFGLIAMCAPVIAFLAMLQNFGLVQATVQKKDLTHADVNFLFWVNLGMSAALASMLALSSTLVASFYEDDCIILLLAALSSTIVISGLGAQHSALLNRKMEFGKLALVTVLGAVATLGVSIGWALAAPSYWALFGGTLAGAAVTTVLTWLWSGWRPGRPATSEGTRELLGFGAGITGFNLTNFFARNADNVLIGKVWGSAELGLYDRAYKLLLFPLGQVSNPLSRVMIPALSRMVDEPDRYRHAYLRVLNLSLLLILPGVAWATASANTLIPFLLGNQWYDSSPIFMALGFAGLLQPLNNPAGWLFISQGRSTEYMIWGAITAVFALTAFAIGIWWAALGVAIAYAVGEYLKTIPLWLYISRRGPVRAPHILYAAGPSVLGAHLAVGTSWLSHEYAELVPAVSLGLSLLVAYATMAITLLCFRAGRETLGEAIGLLKSLLNSRKLPNLIGT